MYRILTLTLFVFALSGCSSLKFSNAPQPRNNSPRKVVALYQKHESGHENIQLAFVSNRGNWYGWRDFAGSNGVSYLVKKPQNWIASYKGKTLANIPSTPSYMSNQYGQLGLHAPVEGLVQTPMVKSIISYPGLAQRPVILENMTSTVPYADPLWTHSTPAKRVIEYTLGYFENFIDNGLIAKNTLAAEDLQVVNGVKLQNGDRVLSIAVTTLSNCDERKTDKRFKSFYIRNDRMITDLTAGHDVDLSCTSSTGLNLRFVDVVEHEGDIAVVFWYWSGVKKGYRLFVPRDNTLHDMDINNY